MNNAIRKHNSKIIKSPAPSKLAVEKYSVLRMVNVFLNALLKKHLLKQLINITMVLAKTLSENVTITIDVLLDIKLVKKTLSCQLREKPSPSTPPDHFF